MDLVEATNTPAARHCGIPIPPSVVLEVQNEPWRLQYCRPSSWTRDGEYAECATAFLIAAAQKIVREVLGWRYAGCWWDSEHKCWRVGVDRTRLGKGTTPLAAWISAVGN